MHIQRLLAHVVPGFEGMVARDEMVAGRGEPEFDLVLHAIPSEKTLVVARSLLPTTRCWPPFSLSRSSGRHEVPPFQTSSSGLRFVPVG